MYVYTNGPIAAERTMRSKRPMNTAKSVRRPLRSVNGAPATFSLRNGSLDLERIFENMKKYFGKTPGNLS